MQTPKGAWTVATMLFLYMLVNFADKAVFGLGDYQPGGAGGGCRGWRRPAANSRR